MAEKFMVSLVVHKQAERSADIMVASAANRVWNGYPLNATLAKRIAPASQDAGSASTGPPQPYPHLSAVGGFQPPPTTVVPVPYLPSDHHYDSSLSGVSLVPPSTVAQGYGNDGRAYFYYEPTAGSTYFHTSGQTPTFAYGHQTGNHQRADFHWTGVPLPCPYQPDYSGNRYGAGNGLFLQELFNSYTGGGSAPWAAPQSTWPGPQYFPATSAICYSPSSVTPMDPSQSASGPFQLAQHAPFAPVQVAHHNSDGTPINLSYGAPLPIEDRGVCIQNLSYQATPTDVENLMRDAGRIVRCEVNTHPGTKSSKGTAFVTFASAEAATKALKMFNDTLFMGRPITVRLDKVNQPLTNL